MVPGLLDRVLERIDREIIQRARPNINLSIEIADIDSVTSNFVSIQNLLTKVTFQLQQNENPNLSGWPGLEVVAELHGRIVCSEGGHPQPTRGHVERKVAVVYRTREHNLGLAQIADLYNLYLLSI